MLWLLNLGFAGGGAAPPVVVGPALSPGGVSRAVHWPAENRYIDLPQKITAREEEELKRLVRKAIDQDNEKAKRKLEEMARKYRDFENSLAAFSQAFQAMSELNRKRFENHRITALAYQRQKEEVEEEEAIILQLLHY